IPGRSPDTAGEGGVRPHPRPLSRRGGRGGIPLPVDGEGEGGSGVALRAPSVPIARRPSPVFFGTS
ncbi:MAG: hypothetical protein RMK79_12075, partial [Anaerolineae bacterium]|nr:hypothetical protein [Anaerolineae bacterium]